MFALVAAAVVLTAQPGAAPLQGRWVEEARILVSQLEFARAIERLEIARKVRGLELAEQKEILEMLAYCQVAEGQRDAAEQTFFALLELDASVELSKEVASPKVVEAFEAARSKHFPADYVRLEERAAPAGRVNVELVDPWKVISAVVLIERRNEGEWESSILSGAAGQFTFPLVVAVGSQLEWFIEARSSDGTVRQRIASREDPRVVKVVRVEQAPTAVEIPAVKTGIPAKRVGGFVLVGAAFIAAIVATSLQVSGFNLRQSARDTLRPPGNWADTALAAERDGITQQAWSVGLFIGAGVSIAVGWVLTW